MQLFVVVEAGGKGASENHPDSGKGIVIEPIPVCSAMQKVEPPCPGEAEEENYCSIASRRAQTDKQQKTKRPEDIKLFFHRKRSAVTKNLRAAQMQGAKPVCHIEKDDRDFTEIFIPLCAAKNKQTENNVEQ